MKIYLINGKDQKSEKGIITAWPARCVCDVPEPFCNEWLADGSALEVDEKLNPIPAQPKGPQPILETYGQAQEEKKELEEIEVKSKSKRKIKEEDNHD